jgi:hypothetical protein
VRTLLQTGGVLQGHVTAPKSFAAQLAPIRVSGRFAGSAPLVNGIVAAGTSVMSIVGGSGAKTIRQIDVLKVADDIRAIVPFRSCSYTTAGAVKGVGFYPPAPNGLADNAAITIVKPARR